MRRPRESRHVILKTVQRSENSTHLRSPALAFGEELPHVHPYSVTEKRHPGRELQGRRLRQRRRRNHRLEKGQ